MPTLALFWVNDLEEEQLYSRDSVFHVSAPCIDQDIFYCAKASELITNCLQLMLFLLCLTLAALMLLYPTTYPQFAFFQFYIIV